MDTATDVELAAERARRRRLGGIRFRRTIFYSALAWYFVFRIAQPVRLECAHVENSRVNCYMLRKWAGVVPADRRNYTDVRRARLDDTRERFGNILLTRYLFTLDTGSLMRSGPSVKWMNRQNGGELEKVTFDLNAWLARPSSTNFRHDLRADFINGMLVIFVSIGVLALIERWIKRRDARKPIEIS